MNSLFGLALPPPANIAIAFIIVLVLIGLAAWLIRRIGTGRLDAAARSRQPRLAVIDSAAVDNRRKLVIIRRDNVEHLLMIGGPNDVVIESAIVRGVAPVVRDIQPARGADTLPRVSPLPDASAWTATPETTLAPPVAPTVRVERERPRIVAEEPAQWPPAQPEPAEAATPPRPSRIPEPVARSQRADVHAEPAAARSQRPDVLAGFAAELSKPAPERPTVPAPRPAPVIDPAADKNLAEMAQRLEQALRQPSPPTAPSATKPAAEPKRTDTKSPRADSPGATPAKSDLESFEQEMATLLGRSGKT